MDVRALRSHLADGRAPLSVARSDRRGYSERGSGRKSPAPCDTVSDVADAESPAAEQACPYIIEYEDGNRNQRRAVIDEKRMLAVSEPPEIIRVDGGRWVAIVEIAKHPVGDGPPGSARGRLSTPPA
jgi:hypothetical protein